MLPTVRNPPARGPRARGTIGGGHRERGTGRERGRGRFPGPFETGSSERAHQGERVRGSGGGQELGCVPRADQL